MARRFTAFTAALALTLGVGVAFATGAGAAAAPVDAHGTLTCSVSGKVKFSTPLTFGSTAGPSAFTAKMKSISCSGSSGVTSFKGTFSAQLSSSDCNALAATGLPAASITGTKLKGASKYNPTTINFAAGGSFTASNPITMDEPGAGPLSTATGSFAGQHPTLHLVFDQTVTTLATNCQPKTKGVKGSGGLKKMSFNASSHIDVS